PDVDYLVAAATGQQSALRRERQRQHRPGVLLERLPRGRRLGGQVPQLDRAVLARRGERLAVGAEGDRQHRSLVTGQLDQLGLRRVGLPRRQLDDRRRRVAVARRERPDEAGGVERGGE